MVLLMNNSVNMYGINSVFFTVKWPHSVFSAVIIRTNDNLTWLSKDAETSRGKFKSMGILHVNQVSVYTNHNDIVCRGLQYTLGGFWTEIYRLLPNSRYVAGFLTFYISPWYYEVQYILYYFKVKTHFFFSFFRTGN